MTFKVGIVGYGVVGKRRHNALKKISDFEVIALSDKSFKDGTKPSGFTCYLDFKDLINFEEIDVLFISLPNNFAAEASIMALEKGMHVFCEKPPAKSLKELLPVKNQVKDSDLKLMYGFNHRFHLSVSKAKQIIEEGSLGKVINLKGAYGKSKMISFNQTDWRTEREKSGGGILLDQGIHMLDLMNYFSGGFVKIFSIIKNSFWNYDVEDNAFVLMENDKGVVAQLHSSATEWRHNFRLEITLEKGSLILDGILTNSKSYGDETLKIIFSDPDNDKGDPLEEEISFDKDISWDLEVRSFTDAIRNSDNIVNGSIDQAIEIMDLIEKIYKSDPNWKQKYYQND
tara:strand:- start:493 stop:1518 length:1026 start_codon:yes stop_codon:yes gene_type:complete